jgi:hypothetical protein
VPVFHNGDFLGLQYEKDTIWGKNDEILHENEIIGIKVKFHRSIKAPWLYDPVFSNMTF